MPIGSCNTGAQKLDHGRVLQLISRRKIIRNHRNLGDFKITDLGCHRSLKIAEIIRFFMILQMILTCKDVLKIVEYSHRFLIRSPKLLDFTCNVYDFPTITSR